MTVSTASLLAALEGTGLAVCYNAFPEGAAVELPWIVYRYVSSNHLTADNKVYKTVDNYDIEYYNKVKCSEDEERIRQALDSLGVIYAELEVTIESENVIEHVFSVQLI